MVYAYYRLLQTILILFQTPSTVFLFSFNYYYYYSLSISCSYLHPQQKTWNRNEDFECEKEIYAKTFMWLILCVQTVLEYVKEKKTIYRIHEEYHLEYTKDYQRTLSFPWICSVGIQWFGLFVHCTWRHVPVIVFSRLLLDITNDYSRVNKSTTMHFTDLRISGHRKR